MSGPPGTSQNYTINKIIDLQDPLGNITLSKNKIRNTFRPDTDALRLQLIQDYPNVDPVIRQLKSWHVKSKDR